jgi:hypothetical protein
MLYSTRRSAAFFGGLIALAGGLWLIAGPSVSMLWNGGVQATGAAIGDTGTRVLEWIGFFYGAGALIALFSAYGLGFLAALPVTGEAAPATATQAPEPATTDHAAEHPAPRPPATRRRRILRRGGSRREPGSVERH